MKYIILLFCFWTLSCANVLEPAANKNTDEALFEDAIKLNNDFDFDGAIAKFGDMSSGFLEREDVREAYASALAGKCGLNFLEYFQDIQNADLSTTPLFKYFMNAFTQKAISPEHCTLAQAQMTAIGATSSERNAGQNLFMAILGMVKMGVYLRNVADIDSTGNLGDGTTDATFSSCSAAADITDAQVKEVVTGLGLVLENIASLGSGDVSTNLGAISAACPTCNVTDPANVDGATVTIMRKLLDTAANGVGACGDATGITCCP